MLSTRQLQNRRKNRTRFQISKKSGDKLRLSVFRSGKHIYAQIIDDLKGHTLVSASTVDKNVLKDQKNGANVSAATKVGEELAVRAKEAGVDTVVFDRGSYKYHGRVKALADAARAGGLKF
ncbi:MAG: 50S ribosomal protein L18 [Alphaproteobacteria bacterium]|jgi:large subunit ribosomal protein L18